MPKPKDEIKEKTEGTESITFRIGKTVMGDLRQEAKKNGKCKYLGKPNNEVLFTMAQAC